MNRAIKLLTILAVVLLTIPVAFAQPNGLPNGNYGGFPMDVQSRNIPAGTVVDPGSQLLYIVDTGINMRTNTDFTDAEKAANNVNQLLGVTGEGGDAQTNFIAITNTHPTQAVTVHFRYFNDECEDVLDFLVILTCNDTLVFDPMNFEIPGTSLAGEPINSKSRIFGPSLDPNIFPAISAETFASGRFLIFATAAGTANSLETSNNNAFPATFDASADQALILFPNELGVALDDECNIQADGSVFSSGGTSAGSGAVLNVGLDDGLVETNLHVFNASAISFNYLTGFWTTAVPKGFIEGVQSDQDQFLAFGVNAWTRPAVDLTADDNESIFPTEESEGAGPTLFNAVGDTDGDGIFVADYLLLAGSEPLKSSDTQENLSALSDDTATNLYYLRNEVHGGDTQQALDPNDTETPDPIGGTSDYGALAWISIFGTAGGAEAANQRVEFLSVTDDYNGSQNSGTGITIGATTITDRSYNLTGAQTRYIVQIYDNNEDKLNLTAETPINISPPPEVAPTADLRIVVDCLRVFIGPTAAETLGRDGLSIANLNEITNLVLAGSGSFDGLGAIIDPVADDGSQGWIRFVRDNLFTRSGVVDGVTVTVQGGTIAPVNEVIMDNQADPTFVTIGQAVIRFEGFGASYWLATSAADPAINNAPETTNSP